jgi:hypothetical protein
VIVAALAIVPSYVALKNDNDAATPSTSNAPSTTEGPSLRAVVKHPVRVDNRWASYPIFLIPRPIGKIPPPPAADKGVSKRYDWANALGGVDAGGTQVAIVVEGRSSSPVVLLDLEVSVLKRRPPVKGSAIAIEPAGDYLQIRHIGVNLDRSPPSLDFTDARMELKDIGTWSFPLVLKKDQVEYIELDASVDNYYCGWIATLKYTAHGEEHSLRIDNKGSPFRTSSTKNAKNYYSSDGKTYFR